MRLPEKERKRIQIRHQVAIEYFGYQPKALFWQNREVQQVRFEVLSQIIHQLSHLPAKLSILDIGCGFGDLYPFLQQQTKKGTWPAFEYFGIDVAPAMVESAGFQYPGIQVQQGELADFAFETGQFDLVMLSGSLNEPFENSEAYAKATIQEAYRVAKFGVTLNLLDARDERMAKADNLQAFDPVEMKSFCEGFAKEVRLREDYLPQDFTLYLL